MRLVFSEETQNYPHTERMLLLDKNGEVLPTIFDQKRLLSIIATQTWLDEDGGILFAVALRGHYIA